MPKLVCRACGLEEPVPEHHDLPMIRKEKGLLRKKLKLVCQKCDYEVDYPTHCGMLMVYVEKAQA